MIGVLVFPGSNCDHDAYHVAKHVCGAEASFVWHKDSDLAGLDAVILPGGFSYGDYLRTGAIARFSPVMKAVVDFANQGGTVIGICNGFQILQEAGLLPGAMLRNRTTKFLSQPVHVRVEKTDTPFTAGLTAGDVLTMPIGHGEGNFYLPDGELDRLEGEGRVVFRYVDKAGNATEAANPNGARRNIAGICDASRRVLGMMPHPERLFEPMLGGSDGRKLFESLLATLH